MAVHPPDYSRPSYPFMSPSLKPMTRELTISKCNIWRACIREATHMAFFERRPFSIYNNKLSIIHDSMYENQ